MLLKIQGIRRADICKGFNLTSKYPSINIITNFKANYFIFVTSLKIKLKRKYFNVVFITKILNINHNFTNIIIKNLYHNYS